jgi:hypothetical protein
MSTDQILRVKAMELAMHYLNEHLENELDLIQVAAEIYTFIQGETK